MLTIVNTHHELGRIAGYGAKETMNEDPDRLATVQRLTWAYLTDEESSAWTDACIAMSGNATSLGEIEQK